MIATILLQASSGGLGSYGSLVPMVLIIVVFYFFMIRPQVKSKKIKKNTLKNLKKATGL